MGSRTIRGLQRQYNKPKKGETDRTAARLGAVDSDLAMIDDRVERDAASMACLAGVLSIVRVFKKYR